MTTPPPSDAELLHTASEVAAAAVVAGVTMMRNFATTVQAMRQAQKKYFKTRSKEALIEAKTLETAVDIRLGELGLRSFYEGEKNG